MERRGCGLGCVVALLGLALMICLLPYLVSSVYSIASEVLQTPGTPDWLWGEWLSDTVGVDTPLYMVLAEGPICCVGALGLLVLVLGVVAVIGSAGPDEPEYEYEDEGYYDYPAGEDDFDQP